MEVLDIVSKLKSFLIANELASIDDDFLEIGKFLGTYIHISELGVNKKYLVLFRNPVKYSIIYVYLRFIGDGKRYYLKMYRSKCNNYWNCYKVDEFDIERTAKIPAMTTNKLKNT